MTAGKVSTGSRGSENVVVRRRRIAADLTVNVALTTIQAAVADVMDELLSLVPARVGRRAVVLFGSGSCGLELARSYAARYDESGRIRPSDAISLETAMFLARIAPPAEWTLTSFVIADSGGSFETALLGSRMVSARRSDIAIVYDLRRSEEDGLVEVTATLVVAPNS